MAAESSDPPQMLTLEVSLSDQKSSVSKKKETAKGGLVMAGPCRGQIWVVSRREDGFSAQPLCTSPWADACPLPASVPDIMRVLAIACWERVAGADPAAFGTV